MTSPGRPSLLDESTQKTFCALIEVGVSRRQAALHVGVSPSAIAKRCERDPAFDQRIRAAEVQRKVKALESLGQHSQRSWRAAVWILENTCPEFAKKPRHEPQGIEVLVDRLLKIVCKKVHDAGVSDRIVRAAILLVIKEFPEQLSPAGLEHYQECIHKWKYETPPYVDEETDDDDDLGDCPDNQNSELGDYGDKLGHDDNENDEDNEDNASDGDDGDAADEPSHVPDENIATAARGNLVDEVNASDVLREPCIQVNSAPAPVRPAANDPLARDLVRRLDNLAPETNADSPASAPIETYVNVPLGGYPRMPSNCRYEEVREVLPGRSRQYSQAPSVSPRTGNGPLTGNGGGFQHLLE